jgi:hypothetical protein
MTPQNPLKALTCLLFVAFLMTGCKDVDIDEVYDGQDFSVKETVKFYLPFWTNEVEKQLGQGDSYKTLPPEWGEEKLSRFLFEGAKWLPPEGTSIIDTSLRARRGLVSWVTDDHEYSALGYYIDASCVLRIEKNAKPGTREVQLYLPAVAQASKVLGAIPRAIHFGRSYQDFPDGMLVVKTITVHESLLSARWARSWKILRVILIVLIVLVLYVVFLAVRD